MPFHSRGINTIGQLGREFEGIANNICSSPAHTVYFAGRSRHLKLFALELSKVGCDDRH